MVLVSGWRIQYSADNAQVRLVCPLFHTPTVRQGAMLVVPEADNAARSAAVLPRSALAG